MGKLKIRKREQDLTKVPKNKWPVDYEKSKELGFIVYFVNDYSYKWWWKKRHAIFKWKSCYGFNPCRAAKRQLASAIKYRKRDYFD